MKLGVLMTVHGRPDLTRQVMAFFARQQERLDPLEAWGFAVGTPDRGAMRADYGLDGHFWQYLQAPNDNLSRRWNIAAMLALCAGMDACIVAGSDNPLSDDCLCLTAEKLREGHDLVIPTTFACLDAPTSRLAIVRPRRYVGCGRAYSRRLFDRFDWRIWSNEVPWLPVAATEHRMGKAVLRQGYRYDPEEAGVGVLDIKTGEGINGFEKMLGQEHHMIDAGTYHERHFPDLGVLREVIL